MPRGTWLLAAALAAGAGCKPRACAAYAQAPKPLSFAAAAARGVAFAPWRDSLRERLGELLRARRALTRRAPVRHAVVSAGWMMPDWMEGVWITNLRLRSAVDGAMIPAAWLRPPGVAEDSPARLAVLLHGHKSGGPGRLSVREDMDATVRGLLREGFVVLLPRVRSLAGFSVDGRSHRAYYAAKADGEFLGEVVGDTLSAIRFLRGRYPKHRSLSLVGHSFGGYAALHLAALSAEADRVVVSGLFLPYGCLDSYAHDGCQRLPGVAELAEISDIAGLVAPRPLLLQFGAKDPNYTPAVDALFARTRAVYAAAGAEPSVRMTVTPGLAHELDPRAVVEFLKE